MNDVDDRNLINKILLPSYWLPHLLYLLILIFKSEHEDKMPFVKEIFDFA